MEVSYEHSYVYVHYGTQTRVYRSDFSRRPGALRRSRDKHPASANSPGLAQLAASVEFERHSSKVASSASSAAVMRFVV
jgi:hypothetical protein